METSETPMYNSWCPGGQLLRLGAFANFLSFVILALPPSPTARREGLGVNLILQSVRRKESSISSGLYYHRTS